MTGWLLFNMLAASIVAAAVLLIRRPVARMFGASAAYALWLLPLARLVMPPFAVPQAVAHAIPSAPLYDDRPVQVALVEMPSNMGTLWMQIGLAIWAGVALMFLVHQWLIYRRFLTGLSLTSRSLDSYRNIPLVESKAVCGPLSVGLLDRRIVVPADFFQRYSEEERALALEHEGIHHRRGDIWWNLIAVLVLAINWFNPIAWRAFRAFREDQELACDAAVAAGAGSAARSAYAEALVKASTGRTNLAVCPLNTLDQLKWRLEMMKTHERSRRRLAGGVASFVLVAAGALAIGSPGAAHPHPDGEGGNREVVIVKHLTDAGEGPAASVDRHSVMVAGCEDGAKTEINEDAEGERTRIVLCTKGGPISGDQLARLRTTRERIAGNSRLSDDQKASVLAALDRAIARLEAR